MLEVTLPRSPSKCKVREILKDMDTLSGGQKKRERGKKKGKVSRGPIHATDKTRCIKRKKHPLDNCSSRKQKKKKNGEDERVKKKGKK